MLRFGLSMVCVLVALPVEGVLNIDSFMVGSMYVETTTTDAPVSDTLTGLDTSQVIGGSRFLDVDICGCLGTSGAYATSSIGPVFGSLNFIANGGTTGTTASATAEWNANGAGLGLDLLSEVGEIGYFSLLVDAGPGSVGTDVSFFFGISEFVYVMNGYETIEDTGVQELRFYYEYQAGDDYLSDLYAVQIFWTNDLGADESMDFTILGPFVASSVPEPTYATALLGLVAFLVVRVGGKSRYSRS